MKPTTSNSSSEREPQKAAVGPTSQIVVLGAGFDTLYWRLQHRGELPTVFCEIDFPTLLARKQAILKAKSEEFAPPERDKTHVYVSADLKDLEGLKQSLRAAGLRFDQPTLFIAEVVISYLPCDDADALSKFVSKTFSRATLMRYEQILPDTSFGTQMVDHFRKRSAPMYPMHRYKTCEDMRRFLERDAGFAGCSAVDLLEYLWLYSAAR